MTDSDDGVVIPVEEYERLRAIAAVAKAMFGILRDVIEREIVYQEERSREQEWEEKAKHGYCAERLRSIRDAVFINKEEER